MKTQWSFVSRVLSVAAVLLLAGGVGAQSLGDIAREQRAKKAAGAATPAKAKRVYSNDNLPREGGLSTTALEAPKGKPGEKAKEGEKEEDKKSAAEEEKAYREKFAKLRDTVALEEKKLDVMQRELNLANVQHYSNPDQALREQTTRAELNTRQAELEKQKLAVAAARQAVTDMEEELRKRALPPGWAR